MSTITSKAYSYTAPERLVEMAWKLNLVISSADKAMLPSDYVNVASKLARQQGIDVHYLDFAKYDSLETAWSAKENKAFVNAISHASKPCILWFDNCDSLAPLSCDLTFWLRSVLTTRNDNIIQAVFIAQQDALQQLFYHNEAAFYQSNFKLTHKKIL